VADYSLRLKRSAAKEIEAIEPKKVRRQIVERIQRLADDPRPHGCEKLTDQHDRYRVRQGQYRVVYQIEDASRSVLVVKVADRREIYKKK
jgi:mRNA interferase RelE/StbE